MKFIFLFIFFISRSSDATEVKKIKINNKTLTVEWVEKKKDRQKGLMYRKKLALNHGMMFVFPKEQRLSFWMKNTFIPLDIGFFDKNKKLLEVLSMKPANSVMETNLPRYKSKEKAKFALEVNRGWFEKNKIKKKSKFIILK